MATRLPPLEYRMSRRGCGGQAIQDDGLRTRVARDELSWVCRQYSKMKQAKRSTMWEHFDRKNVEVICKLCNVGFKYSSYYTTEEANTHKHRVIMEDNKLRS